MRFIATQRNNSMIDGKVNLTSWFNGEQRDSGTCAAHRLSLCNLDSKFFHRHHARTMYQNTDSGFKQQKELMSHVSYLSYWLRKRYVGP